MLPTPAQNYDHLCEAVSGSDAMHDLQYTAFKRAAADSEFQRGSIVSLNDAGELVNGCTNGRMPMWTKQSFDDLDADFALGGIADTHYTAFVATGGYELKTTEFDVAGAYISNSPLIADGVTGNVALGASVLAAVNVVGIVSRPASTDTYRQDVLHFWPVYLPARA